MSFIWLDVTTILDWHRPAIGLIRVEAECASHLLSHALEVVRFCRFEAGAYSSVEPTEVRATLDRIGGRDGPAAEIPAASESMAAAMAEAPAGDFFGPDDVYISLGLDWDQKDLALLHELKTRIGFGVLLCCYDLIPIKFPHLCVEEVATKFLSYVQAYARCADEVICISQCSQQDLREQLAALGQPCPATSVIRLGCQLPGGGATPSAIAPDVAEVLGRRCILFVSTIERRKNHEILYRAYVRLVEQGERDLPLLVFVGMPGWGVGELVNDLLLDPRVRPLVRILGRVSDADLARLYDHALFTVYPSRYEGWGLPVAESLAAGKFCLASNAASIPEIGGDLIEYLDPECLPQWVDRLKWHFDHPQAVADREAAIRESFVPMPWSGTAGEILKAAQRLLSRQA